jgi:hypothetical protein
MWSDECSVERGRGKLIVWVFGPRADKWKPELVTTYKTGKDIRVMVWGALWIETLNLQSMDTLLGHILKF